MSVEVFLDSNVLIYAVSSSPQEAAKRDRALDLIEGKDFGLSAQVLQEFYTLVTRRLARTLIETDAERATRSFAQLPVVTADAHLVLDAISLSRRHRLSLWDALIVQAAVKAGCTTVLTEALQDGLEIGTLRIANPFLDAT